MRSFKGANRHVAAAAAGAAKQGGTLRVNLSDTDVDYFDPALSYTQWTWGFTYLTN